jgi:hypothetical protein
MIIVYFESNGYSEKVATFQSEKLYVEMYDNLLSLAKKMGFDKVTEHEEEEWLSSAEHYLSGSNTAEQVYKIANHKDQGDLIDNVNGVFVWELVENNFTCSEFLETIGYQVN